MKATIICTRKKELREGQETRCLVHTEKLLLTNARKHSHPTVGVSLVRVRRVVMLGARSERPFERGLREGSCQTVVVFFEISAGQMFHAQASEHCHWGKHHSNPGGGDPCQLGEVLAPFPEPVPHMIAESGQPMFVLGK